MIAIEVLKATVNWTVLFALRIIMVLLGFIMVPLGLKFFSKIEPETKQRFTQLNMNEFWVMENLPHIFWPWGNDRDGARGDTRGWWDVNTPFTNSSTFWSKVWWLAIRNPTNNFARFTPGLAVDMNRALIEVLAGSRQDIDDDILGWQFLKARGKYFSYWKFEWSFMVKGKVLHVLLGHKFDIRHRPGTFIDDQKAWKGSTFRIRLAD